MGTAIIKVLSVKPEYWQIKAPVLVFNDQEELQKSFQSGALHDKDFVTVIRYQGPKANGISGASGKIPAAIHVTQEALDNGFIARLQDGDIVFFDIDEGKLTLLEDLAKFNA